MKLSSLIQSLNKPYKESDLIPACTVHTKDDQRRLEEEYGQTFPLFFDVEELCKKHGINPSYIYITPNHFERYCYYHFPAFVSIAKLDEHSMDALRIPERIQKTEKIMQEALSQNDVMSIVSFSDDNAKTMLLNKLYWLFPVEQRYQLWLEVYQLLDFGHALIDRSVFEDALLHQPIDYRKRMLKRLERSIGGNKTLTVYRGNGKASTDPVKSVSWSVSLSVASFFASRYENEGKVYQATIDMNHIIDYLQNRGEEEILLRPEHLENVQEYPMLSFTDEIKNLNDEGYIDEYCTYRNTYMEDGDYLHPDGIHGVPHVKRVMYHCLAMARHLGLSSSERAILVNSALYHDIGRKHDGYCLEHGEWSWKKLERKMKRNPLIFLTEVNYVEQKGKEGENPYKVRKLSNEEKAIVKFIMEYHCRSDRQAKRDLEHQPITDKEKAWKLFEIFKDCDGLDRIRLSKDDLDVAYLRTDIAKQRVMVAYNARNVEGL